MKKMTWISPLEERITKTPYASNNSLFRAVSVVSPEFVYYYLSQLLTYGLAYMIGTGQYQTNMSDFFRNNSLFCAAMIRILAVTVAVAPLSYSFFKEYPVILPGKNKVSGRIMKVCVLAAASSLLFNVIAVSTGFTGSSSSFSQTSSSQFSLPIWAGVIVYGIITPVTEEMVHRGLIYNRLRRYFGVAMAIIGSSLIFGVFHGNIVQLVYGSIMGLIIAYVYERYGAFIYPVLFHCTANIVVYVCMSIDKLRYLAMSYVGITVETILVIGTAYLLITEGTKSQENIDT